MNIVLVGYMGSGKSTIGKLLAQKLNLTFIDSDVEIEKEMGQSISQMFSEKGEAYFRELETEFLLHNEFDNCVISTGGGMPCFHNNTDKINLIGQSVYLEVAPIELLKRVNQDSSQRPVLDNAKTIEFITEHLASRMEYYNRASITVDANLDSEKVRDSILYRLTSIESH